MGGELPPAFCQCDAETHAICSDRLHKHTHTSVKSKQFSSDGKPNTNGSEQWQVCIDTHAHLLISFTWSWSCHYAITTTVVSNRNYHLNEMQQLHLCMLLRDKKMHISVFTFAD